MAALREAFNTLLCAVTEAVTTQEARGGRPSGLRRSRPHAGVQRLLRTAAEAVPGGRAGRVFAGVRLARQGVCTAVSRPPSSLWPSCARWRRRGCACGARAPALTRVRQADFEVVCSESRARLYLAQLDRACEAQGVAGLGVDAAATRRVV